MNRILLLMALVCAGGAAQVRFEDILKGPGENWLTYAGSYNGWRYAPGRQVTPQNAGSLVPKWIYHVPDARVHADDADRLRRRDVRNQRE